MKKYVTPDFDVTVYEIEEAITVSFTEEPTSPKDPWFPGNAQ